MIQYIMEILKCDFTEEIVAQKNSRRMTLNQITRSNYSRDKIIQRMVLRDSSTSKQ